MGEIGPFRYSKGHPGEGGGGASDKLLLLNMKLRDGVIATVQPEARITSFSEMKGNY